MPDSVRRTLSRPRTLRAGFAAEVADLEGSGLLHGGEQWAPARFMITEHSHPVWEWYLQLHGVTRWYADRRTWTIRPGDVFGVAPHTRHAMAETAGMNHHFYYAALDPAPAFTRRPALALGWPDDTRVVHLVDGSRLIEPFAQLMAELAVDQSQLDAGLQLAVERLLLELSRRLQQGAAQRQLGIHPAVHDVQTIIDREYARGVSLRELGDAVGLAPTYLAGLFATQLGRSPHQYLTERRIERAKQLLTASNLSVTAIATEVGFSSGQHLARVFRQQVGTTPRAYRRPRPGRQAP